MSVNSRFSTFFFLFVIFFLIPLLFLGTHRVWASLSPEAQRYINKLPNKEINLSFVIKEVLLSPEVSKSFGLQYLGSYLDELGRRSYTDTLWTSRASYQDDQLARTTPFQLPRLENREWAVGLVQNWSTGTKTSLEWVQSRRRGELFPNLSRSNFSQGFLVNFNQSFASVRLEQSLLKDAFGQIYRNQLRASRQKGEAMRLKIQEEVEKKIVSITDLYYQSWLIQQQLLSLQLQVQGQKKLLAVTRRKKKKGAVEQADLLAVEVLLESTQVKEQQLRTQSHALWENLVTLLDLPKFFLEENPSDIPIKLDRPTEISLKLCSFPKTPRSARVKSLEKSVAATRLNFEAVKTSHLPDLKFILQYQGNGFGFDSNGWNSWDNVWSGVQGRRNPGRSGYSWNTGLMLNWPLGHRKARLDQANQYMERERAEIELSRAKDEDENQWRNLCRRLKTEAKQKDTYKNLVQQQRQRLRAENRRFILGRIGVNQLVQVENDLWNWEFLSHQKAVEVRQVAWRVQSLSGDLYKKVAPLIQQIKERIRTGSGNEKVH